MKEWTEENKWNPFNSFKLLAHVERWQYIAPPPKQAPHPVLVTIDPINTCNLNCHWCNSGKILENRNKHLSSRIIERLPIFLSDWESTYPLRGVRAVCIAGGGEPTLHPALGILIRGLVNKGIEVGIVTNGTHISRFKEELSLCTWVGVSIDAGKNSTYKAIKGVDLMYDVLLQIEELNDYSKRMKKRLALPREGYGITYKFLLHPSNFTEIDLAARLAKRYGCRQLHIRPYGLPWFRLGNQESGSDYKFSIEQKEEFETVLIRAREYFEDDSFKIYGITHKFDGSFSINNNFQRCHALFMTGVIMPGEEPDTYSFGLCCDRRGDRRMELISNQKNLYKIEEFWGGEEHWKIFNNLQVKSCPRCTYQPHNQIYEKVIKEDSMTWKFI